MADIEGLSAVSLVWMHRFVCDVMMGMEEANE